MTVQGQIPIVVGVTGHCRIAPTYIDRLYQLVLSRLMGLRERYPHSPVLVLSSLAEGADQLCARAALAAGCRLVAPLPFAPERYRADFSPEGQAEFDRLLTAAEQSFVVPTIEPAPEGEPPPGFYYRQAGIYIAAHSHILLALWDGAETRAPDGGGTYETVDFMLRESWHHTDSAPFKAEGDGVVWHIVTPRADAPPPEGLRPLQLMVHTAERDGLAPDGAQAQPTPEDSLFLRAVLRQTDRFNHDAARYADEIGRALPGAYGDLLGDGAPPAGGRLRTLAETYCAADTLSLHYRNRRLGSLRALSVIGLMLVLFFLLYDEMESDFMLPFYALGLLAALMVYRRSGRREFHRKYLEYRMLAEALRVQFYWALAGIPAKAHDQFTWSQKMELVWIKEALAAVDTAPPGPEAPPDMALVRRCWVDAQLGYHRSSAVKKTRSMRLNQRMTTALLVLSVALFFLVAGLELFQKDLLTRVLPFDALRSALWIHPEQDILVRGLFKILLGGVSAGTAFLSNYYGKLMLSQQIRENRKLRKLYGMAGRQLEQAEGDPERQAFLLFALGREELIEAGDWLLFHSDNAPELVM